MIISSAKNGIWERGERDVPSDHTHKKERKEEREMSLLEG